jgi:hypothetical protein
MKTFSHFPARNPNLFHMHPFNALFSLVASLVLMLLLTLMILLSIR